MWVLGFIFLIVCVIVIPFTRQRKGESYDAYKDRVGITVASIMGGLVAFALLILAIYIS